MAKKSQFLATIKTDVPFDIDAMNFRRETSDIQYTDELLTFLRKYEFRSLMPADITLAPAHYTLTRPPELAQ
jgi:5'-3' exonuclease